MHLCSSWNIKLWIFRITKHCRFQEFTCEVLNDTRNVTPVQTIYLLYIFTRDRTFAAFACDKSNSQTSGSSGAPHQCRVYHPGLAWVWTWHSFSIPPSPAVTSSPVQCLTGCCWGCWAGGEGGITHTHTYHTTQWLSYFIFIVTENS